MKILQVVPYFFIDWAGGTAGHPVETVYGPSKALTKRAHEVTVFTTDAFNKRDKSWYQGEPSQLEIDGLRVREYKNMSHKLGTKYHMVISPAMIPAMAKELGEFDIVHLHEYRTFQNITAHHYAKKYGVPYVVQAHGSLPRTIGRHKLKQLYDNVWGYNLLKDAAKVIAVTNMEAEQYKSFGLREEQIEIIPNGIDLSDFDNLPEKGEFRDKCGLSADQPVILFLGRINEIKGLDLLVRAIAELSQEIKNIRLVIVGPDDGYLRPLQKLITDLEISDRVLFPGPLYGQEKLKVYVDADVYVLPSSYEIFSITVLEAGACGTPVIVTDRCGLADAINGQTGLVIGHDKEQLRGALQHLLGDENLRQKYGKRGKLLVKERFNWDIIAEQLEGVYKAII